MSAQQKAVQRWVKKSPFVSRIGTHESQKAPAESEGAAMDYILTVREKVAARNRHQDYIINMDQTPVPFTFNEKRTLELVGKRTVHIRKSTSDTKRVTFAATITASGLSLTPYLVFKGKPTGRIVKEELHTFNREMLYACQENAWMDERVMLLWVEKVLKSHVENAPDWVVPLLFLDAYRCHMMASVVTAIQELGVEIEHIPGGCTYMAQPVDIGWNKPFKSRVRDMWEAWMMAEGLVSGTTRPPKRKDIAEWAHKAWKDLPKQMVINSWRHGEYAYFLPTCAVRPNDAPAPSNNEDDSDELMAV